MLDEANKGSAAATVAALATIVLATLGLALVVPECLVAVATIVFGATLLLHCSAMIAQHAHLNARLQGLDPRPLWATVGCQPFIGARNALRAVTVLRARSAIRMSTTGSKLAKGRMPRTIADRSTIPKMPAEVDQESTSPIPWRGLSQVVNILRCRPMIYLGVTQQEGANQMCDYSLHHIASRPAKVGDELITTRFGDFITRGFSAIGEPNVAVCLLPGTEIAFAKEAEHRNPLVRLLPGLGFAKLSGKVARFRQVNLDNPQTHHDALEFADGKIVLLTLLRPGQRATVLQLPVRPRSSKEVEPHRSKGMSREEPVALIS